MKFKSSLLLFSPFILSACAALQPQSDPKVLEQIAKDNQAIHQELKQIKASKKEQTAAFRQLNTQIDTLQGQLLMKNKSPIQANVAKTPGSMLFIKQHVKGFVKKKAKLCGCIQENCKTCVLGLCI